jgi:hypothetical protein
LAKEQSVEQAVNLFDDRATGGLVDIMREVSVFVRSVQEGIIGSDYQAHKAFYVKVSSDLEVLSSIIAAQGAGDPVAEGLVKATGSLRMQVDQLESFDKVHGKLDLVFFQAEGDLFGSQFAALLAAAYSTRAKCAEPLGHPR